MKTIIIYFFIICSALFFSSCEKNIAKKYTGQFYFTTEASSHMLEVTNDSVIYFSGSVTADSKNTLKIEYGPRLMSTSSSTTDAKIFMDGIIYPTIDANGNFTYPDYLTKDINNIFSGGFDDNGNINITLGNHGLAAGYTNIIHGKRLE